MGDVFGGLLCSGCSVFERLYCKWKDHRHPSEEFWLDKESRGGNECGENLWQYSDIQQLYPASGKL